MEAGGNSVKSVFGIFFVLPDSGFLAGQNNIYLATRPFKVTHQRCLIWKEFLQTENNPPRRTRERYTPEFEHDSADYSCN
jgi:hypothetical protein